jgi:hypothetical protein
LAAASVCGLPPTGSRRALTSTIQRAAVLSATVLFSVGSLGLAACSDEDGDGGTTDEEIQDLEDTGDSIEDQIQEEVDSQDKGTNEDNE